MGGQSSSLCPPPPNFRAAGEILWAELSFEGPWGNRPGKPQTSAQAAGLRYERKTHCHLISRYPGRYGGGQWISFRNRASGTVRWAQPDGIILDWRRRLIIIVEVKYTHSTAAWWALRHLYEPLLRFLFPEWEVASCEVTRWFDGAVRWPEAHRMVREPVHLKAGEIGVHLFAAK